MTFLPASRCYANILRIERRHSSLDSLCPKLLISNSKQDFKAPRATIASRRGACLAELPGGFSLLTHSSKFSLDPLKDDSTNLRKGRFLLDLQDLSPSYLACVCFKLEAVLVLEDFKSGDN